MSINRSYMPALILLFLTIFSGLVLSSAVVSADDTAVDNVSITVPVSCTLSGVGMNTHNATISPGTYNSSIGETTIRAFCNDGEGFGIYAIGYTNDTDGNNTLRSTNLTTPITISTGTGTSGNSSQWAMKLATQSSPTPAYPITIQNSFDSFHTVPADYTLVAKRTAGTDIGASATGSTLTTTYQVYISSAQAAGTYVGKVKYVLTHPSTAGVPLANDLTGSVLRFDEHPDVLGILDGYNYSRRFDVDYAVKITVEELVEHAVGEGYNVTNWSQLVALLPDYLAAYGCTNIEDSLQVIDSNDDYVYINYISFGPTYDEYNGTDHETIFYNHDKDNHPEELWSHLPAFAGSLSFIDSGTGDTVTIASATDLMLLMFSGAWTGEAYFYGDWSYDFFKTVYIYGGADATDTELIEWLSENANLLRMNDMENTTWQFNDTTNIDTLSRFDVSGQVQNGQYQAYDFDYISSETLYGVTFWTFYYYNTTSPYSAGDGFIYIPDDVSIPEYGINYSAGWYFGNSYNPTGLTSTPAPTINIDGGDDLVNPSFIDWLNDNAVKN